MTEELHGKLEQIHVALEAHIARQDEWQTNMVAKLDEHIEDHKKSSERWHTGWIGFLFSTIGAAVLLVWQVVTSHHTK